MVRRPLGGLLGFDEIGRMELADVDVRLQVAELLERGDRALDDRGVERAGPVLLCEVGADVALLKGVLRLLLGRVELLPGRSWLPGRAGSGKSYRNRG